jgi:AraC-like DNA-binding protein
MILEILPANLIALASVKLLLQDNKSTIYHKTLGSSLLDKEMYLSSIAILYIVRGKQIISNYDGTAVTVNEGQLLFLSKDMYLVSDFVTDNNHFEAIIFFIDDSVIQQNITPRKNYDIDNVIPTLEAGDQIAKYMQSLLDVYRHFENSNEILAIKVRELLALIKLQDNGGIFLSQLYSLETKHKRRDIREFMELNFLKNLNIDDYALLTGRSKSTFMREFKKLYATTPNQWLIEKRLSKGHEMLINTNINVTDIAFEVGYENVSHFIKAYKKRYKTTPKQLKSNLLAQIAY